MIGALIGDIAASSWSKDRDIFYSKLIDSDMEPSVYGHAVLKAASRNLISDSRIDTRPIGSPDELQYHGQWLMWQIVAAWIEDEDTIEIPRFLYLDKDKLYASWFIKGLIRLLKSGASKSEAFYATDFFSNMIKNNKWHWKDLDFDKMPCDNILLYVFRAWDSFYRGFDFTSSLHNAMKWSGDKNLLGALTGAFAEAMYGCQFYMIKKKYAGENPCSDFIDLLHVSERFGYHHGLVHEMFETSVFKRAFFAKNNAMTNVEFHAWKDQENILNSLLFTDEEHRRILLSAPTSWDCRYGFYLDDGWIYIYRSNVLIGRFKMCQKDYHWRITSLQNSGDRTYSDLIMGFFSALNYGCNIHKENLAWKTLYLNEFKYYEGSLSVPEEWKGKTEERFWYGEKMFLTTITDLKPWEEKAEQCRNSLIGENLRRFNDLSQNQQVVICFIETLYQKWCPMKNKDWIMEY